MIKGSHEAGPFDKQSVCFRSIGANRGQTQRAQFHDSLADDAETLAAGRKDDEVRASSQGRGDKVGGSGQDVFAIIQDEEPPTRA